MAGRIPKSFIDELVSRADIVEIIDEYVPLKKSGRDYKACCPFHEEKTPSFTVSPAKQFYHCFGCQAHGTAIGFLIDYANMEFVDAVEELARRLGLEVPRDSQGTNEGEPSEPIYAMVEEANLFYQRQLRHHPEAARAVEYLKGRGVSGEIAAEFQLGFAPPGWDNLVRELGTTESAQQLLLRAGLVAERSGGGLYDRFRERIMFPIHDRRSRSIGFGGRILADDTPKYLNSPETPVFHKGRELYGLVHARNTKPRLPRVFVVEGYMDVVALAQHGVRNSVASLGTSLTSEHLSQLFRIWPDVVFCFDGDEAGRRAGWRALEIALPQMREGRQAFFMFLPEGEDPDSAVRANGRAHFERLADEAQSLGTFLFQHLSDRVDLETIDGRSRLHELARPLLARIPPGSFQRLAGQRLAELTGIDAVDLSKLSGGARETKPPKRRVTSRVKPANPTISPARKAITLLVQSPELADVAGALEALKDLESSGARLLVELIELLVENPNLTTAAIIERYRDHETGRHLASLAAAPVDLEVGWEQEFQDCLQRVIDQGREQREEERFKVLAAKDLSLLSEEDKRELSELTRRRGC